MSFPGEPTSESASVWAITSGKGGVGKTTLSLNLGISLSRAGRQVLLIDADLGLANIDILLGLAPEATVEDLLQGRASAFDVVVPGHRPVLADVEADPAVDSLIVHSVLTQKQKPAYWLVSSR